MSDDLFKKRGLFSTKIESMPAEMKRGWSVIVERPDGSLDELSEVARVTIVNPKFGALNYGKSPLGAFDQWAFHEVAGGGSVIVPYVRLPAGELFVGLLEEKRPFQSATPVWNVPRGFLDPKEKHFEAAGRELKEEAGLEVEQLQLLPGEPVNPNSAFFETWGEAPDGQPEGIRFFAVELPKRYLKWTDMEAGRGLLDPEVVKPATKGLAEKICKCEFRYIFDAIGNGDGFTDIALSRLVRTYYGRP